MKWFFKDVIATGFLAAATLVLEYYFGIAHWQIALGYLVAAVVVAVVRGKGNCTCEVTSSALCEERV